LEKGDKIMPRITRWVGGVLCIFLAVPGFPQEKSTEKTLKVEAVEVVASPIIEGNQVTDYASQVTIVTDKQIDGLNALDLPSALRRAPGVNISRYNLVGSYGGKIRRGPPPIWP